MKKEIDNTFIELPRFLSTMIAPIQVKGKFYSSIKEWDKDKVEGENIIIINPIKSDYYKIIVKESALQDTPFFQYHKLRNNNNPIPMTEMYGVKLEETEKSVKMKLESKDKKTHWTGWLVKNWIVHQEKLK